MTAGMERRAEAIAAKAHLADRNRTDARRAAVRRNSMWTAEKAVKALVGDAWSVSSDGRTVFGSEQGSERAFLLSRKGRGFSFEVSPDGRRWNGPSVPLMATNSEGAANEVLALLYPADH